MLKESDVIAAVCQFLEARGFVIKQRLLETQQGDDIIAVSRDGNTTLVIEAKGETSSQEHTHRFGQPFNSAQVNDHVAKAIFRALREIGTARLSAIALPKNDLHVKAVEKVKNALRILEIEVFWIMPDHTVEFEGFGSFLVNSPSDEG